MDLNPNDFKNYVALLNGVAPEEIIQQFRVAIADFTERTLESGKNQSLLIVGRKAAHLFQTVFRRLLEKGYSLTFIRNLKNNAFWTSGDIPKTVSLLTDCINSGDEILNVAEFVNFEGCNIDKVFSYASKIDGLARLKREEPTAQLTIVSAHELDQSNSEGFFRRLQAYYQSWLEPMDADHSYDAYRLPFPLNPENFLSIIDSGCQNALGRSDIHFCRDDDLYLPSNMMSMSMDLGDIAQIRNAEILTRIQPLLARIKFDFPQLRVKVQFDPSGTQFCIIGCFSPVELPSWVFGSKECCSFTKETRCYHDIIRSEIPVEDRWVLVCPLCVENYVARLILDQVEKHVTTLFPTTETKDIKLGANAISVQKYNPIERPYLWRNVEPT